MPIRNDYFRLGGNYYYEKKYLVPDGKLLAYVLPNRLLKIPFYTYHGGNIPDTRGILGGDRVANCGRTPLTDKLQNLIFYENFKLAWNMEFFRAPKDIQDRAVKEWVYLLGYKLAFANDAGSGTRKVPLANLNMSADWPAANQLAFPGIIELADDKPRWVLGNPNQLPFYTINGQHPHIEDFTPDKYPYRWKRPALIKWAQLNGGVEGTEPFDQLLGKATLRWPTLSNGTEIGFIDASLVKILKPGDVIPSPFTKDWGS